MQRKKKVPFCGCSFNFPHSGEASLRPIWPHSGLNPACVTSACSFRLFPWWRGACGMTVEDDVCLWSMRGQGSKAWVVCYLCLYMFTRCFVYCSSQHVGRACPHTAFRPLSRNTPQNSSRPLRTCLLSNASADRQRDTAGAGMWVYITPSTSPSQQRWNRIIFLLHNIKCMKCCSGDQKFSKIYLFCCLRLVFKDTSDCLKLPEAFVLSQEDLCEIMFTSLTSNVWDENSRTVIGSPDLLYERILTLFTLDLYDWRPWSLFQDVYRQMFLFYWLTWDRRYLIDVF